MLKPLVKINNISGNGKKCPAKCIFRLNNFSVKKYGAQSFFRGVQALQNVVFVFYFCTSHLDSLKPKPQVIDPYRLDHLRQKERQCLSN